MSLINAMLRDLDERQARRPGVADVLEGLRPARALKGKSAMTRTIATWVGAIVLFGIVVSVAPLNIADWVGPVVGARWAPIDSALPAASDPARQRVLGASPAIDAVPTVGGGGDPPAPSEPLRPRPGLKLAFTLGSGLLADSSVGTTEPLVPGIAESRTLTSLETVRVSGNAVRETVVLGFTKRPLFALHAQADPPAAILDLEQTVLGAHFPVRLEGRHLVKGLHSMAAPSGGLRVMFELDPGTRVTGPELVESMGFYHLRIAVERTAAPGAQSATIDAGETGGAGLVSGVDEASRTGELIVRSPRAPNVEERARRYYLEAAALVDLGRPADAEQSLRSALAENPSHVNARLLLAASLIENGRDEEAVQTLETGLSIDPDEARLARYLARLLVAAGDNDKALSVLQRSSPDLASDPEYHAFTGAVLQRMGRHRESVEVYRQVLQQRPDQGIWWVGLAISLEALAENREALDAFREASRARTLGRDLQTYVSERINALTRRADS